MSAFRLRPRLVFLASLFALLLAGVPTAALAESFERSISADEAEMLRDLERGAIVEAERFSQNGNTGNLWKVTVEHEGRRREAIFKPHEYGDRDGWARTPMEVAVYKLDRMLKLDLVPPVVYRREVDVDFKHFAAGALVLWVDGAHRIAGVPEHEWNPRREAFSSDLRILQILSRDADNQNIENIIRARHWRNGAWRLMKVDNEAAMRPGSYVNLDHKLPTWGKITRFRRQTFERLKELRFDDLKKDVGDYMSDGEIRDWLATRDGLVAHIQKRAAEDGGVFFGEAELAVDNRQRKGPRATAKLRAKFELLMRQKGVEVVYTGADDPLLGGAQGRTLLGPKRIRIVLPEAPTRATLAEELVHVNQLRTMAKGVGGLAALHQRMSAESRESRDLVLSMELYAKGRVGMLSKSGARDRARAAQRRFERKLGRPRSEGRTLWRPAARRASGRR